MSIFRTKTLVMTSKTPLSMKLWGEEKRKNFKKERQEGKGRKKKEGN